MKKKKNVTKEYRNLVIISFVLIFLAFGVGYTFGIEKGVKECINYGVVLAHNFVNISFDNEKMANILYTYRGKIETTLGGLN